MLGFVAVIIIGLVVIFAVKRWYNKQRDLEKDSNYRQYQLPKLLTEFDELLAEREPKLLAEFDDLLTEHDYKNHQLWK